MVKSGDSSMKFIGTRNGRNDLRLIVILFTFFTGWFFSQTSYAGSGFSEQGNALSEALYEELIKTGVCMNTRMCGQALQLYSEEGKKIYFNIYGQKDTLLASRVAAFLVEKGLKITGGMSITLRAFPQPKKYYLGFFRGLFGISSGSWLTVEIHQ